MRMKNIRITKKQVLLICGLLLIHIANAGTRLPGALRDTLVTGVIADAENNQPLAGATIHVKETGASVITDENGKFSIVIPNAAATLVITNAGFHTKEINIDQSGEFPLLILLDRSGLELENVIVSTGYQKVSREKIVGSVSVIDNHLLNQQVGTNILQRLNNVTSGVLFHVRKNDDSGNPNEFSIRGLSTISGPVKPLIVLDNFIYEGDIANINPNDVDNITILKDAAATSLWVARAGNGVVVISTKRAGLNQRPQVNFSANWTVTQKPDLFYPSTISVDDYIEVEKFMFDKGYFNNVINNTIQKPPLSPVVEILLKKRSGLITETEAEAQIQQLSTADSKEHFDKYFYRKGNTQQYNATVSGSSNHINWIFSGSFDKSIYALSNTFDKANLRLNNTYQPGKNLSINIHLLYSGSKAQSGMTPSNVINGRTIPYLSFMNDDGTEAPIDRYRRGFTDTVGAGLLPDWKYYPLSDYKHDRTTTNVNDILAGTGINYRIIPSLSFKVDYQYQVQATQTTRLATEESFYTRDLINTFARINYNNQTVSFIVPRGSILNNARSNLASQNLRAQLNFDKIIDQHSVTGIAGAEIREVKRESNTFNT